ncbi:hypothetical protein M9Y10_022865 [Tritrichomonas musculus]|uniref:Uncharacterized protein n=1 Tax=Tritrichomonas musculus TaxID=1915356 RepID=A0ABR2KTV9_9EUKA
MGCCSSGVEKQKGINESYIEIPLLQTSRTTENTNKTPYYTMDDIPRKPSYEGNIIEHSTLSVVATPEVEESRKQTFKECFSHIDVNTFQNVPFMSVQSHLSAPQYDSLQQSQFQTHKFEEYSQFLDRVINSILVPLQEMKVQDETNLTTLLDQ